MEETPEVIEVVEVDEQPKRIVKRRKRKPKPKRAYVVWVGKRRVDADEAGVSSGLLYYVVDGVHTYLPVTKKVVIEPVAYSQPPGGSYRVAAPLPPEAPAFRFVDPQPVQDADLRMSEEFAEQRESGLEAMMRPPFRLEG